MIQRLQVFWITPIPSAPFHRISHIAGRYPDGSRWELSSDEAISAIRTGQLSLCVIRKGAILDVVPTQYESRQYLKCIGDDLIPSQLLTLPSFQPGRGYLI